MADSDLIFRQLPLAQPADLLFGESEEAPDYTATLVATMPLPAPLLVAGGLASVTLVATMPPLVVSAVVAPVVEVVLTGTMPGLQVIAEARYVSDTQRPTVAQAGSTFQSAVAVSCGAAPSWSEGRGLKGGARDGWQGATPIQGVFAPGWTEAGRLRSSVAPRHQQALPVSAAVGSSYKAMLRGIRPALRAAWELGEQRSTQAGTDWQDLLRDRRPLVRSAYQEAQRLLLALEDSAGAARPIERGWRGRYQEAIVPPAGISLPPVIPPGVPCYTPPPGALVPLLFVDGPGSSQLVFICEKHGPTPGDTVVVPVRRVYIVINNVSLLKVVGATLVALPTYSLSLALDVDSWTWGLNASLPAEALPDLLPVAGQPVELQASINGVAYRFLAEKLSRERSFGKASIRLTGRGKSALLAAPYAPIKTFSSNTERTAQQLMGDVLTDNGVPIGWDVEWNIDDWLVPAGAWNKQGSYIDGLGAIAAAGGAYLQPHPTDSIMRVLSRYPSAPWEWSAITPDFELPSAVVQVESMEWVDKPVYNRVFVSGVSAGINGQVTRTGTAGDLLAPMVSDPLITAVAAARQRGRMVLSDTGRQLMVSLKLPVLEETGIIAPGKFVRYVDGSEVKQGIVRSTHADSNGQADLWQTLSVETHEEA